MAAKFDVDFSEALRQLAEFQTQTKKVGEALDKLQQESGKPATAAGKLVKEMHSYYTQLEDKLRQLGIDTERNGKTLQASRATAQGLFASLAAENLKLTVSAKAYNGELSELERLLKDSANKSSFIRWSQRASALQQELAGQNRLLSESLRQVGSAEARRNLELKARLASEERMSVAGYRQAQANNELRQQLELLSSASGRANEILKARISAVSREIREEANLSGKLKETQRAYGDLQGGLRSQIAVQGEVNRGLAQAATFRQREQNAVDELLRRQQSLTGGLAEQAAQLRALNQAREKEITELTRQKAKLEELQRTLASLNGGEQEQIARLNAKIAARKKAIQEEGRAVVVMEELSSAAARLIASEQRQKSALEAKNRATLEAARSLHQMTAEEAASIARGEALAAANKRHADTLLDEARKAHGMSKAQQELSQNRQREIDRLERLRAQRELLNSTYGQELAALQRQISEQQRYNRLLTMTTAELLGFTNAQRQSTAALSMGSQSAAMMRAGLSGLHSSIGMYTSSTIIAASSTYALASALRSTVTVGAEFSASMARADAIMSTSGPRWMPSNMDAMEAQVRALGQSTIYTASEVAQGLVELGQAGLSASESITALKPSLDLAMIGGISMAQSADIATNVMSTFALQAKDLSEVVDVMAQAAANSNTNVEQLASALTYAGPAAHTAGISMRDTVAAIEALSNTGIKASRAGTGLRRLFVSLLNPTEKGAAMLDKYGIAVQDAEGNTRSLIDILGQLNKALHNVDVSEGERLGAVQDLVGVYATSPVAALIGQAGEGGNLQQLRRQLDDVAGAAERMREKIENSLKYDWKQVGSAFEELQLQVFDVHEYRLRELTASFSKYLLDLSQPIKAISAETGAEVQFSELDKQLGIFGDKVTVVISELDLLIQRATVFGETMAWALGGAAAYKLAGAGGSVFGALAADSKKASERLGELSRRSAATSASVQSLALSTSVSSTAMRVQGAVALSTSAALTTAAGSASWLAGKLELVAIAGNLAMRALGWAGLLYGVYSAFSTVFGSDSERAIIDQKTEVDSLKDSYEDLKKEIEKTALARERAALNKQIGNDQNQIGALSTRNFEIVGASQVYKDSGAPVPLALTEEYASNERLIAGLQGSISAAGDALSSLKQSQADAIGLADQAISSAKKLADLQKAEAEARQTYEDAEGRMRLKQKDAWDTAKAAVETYRASLQAVAETTDTLVQKTATMGETYRRMLEDQTAVLADRAMEKQGTAAERLVWLQEKILAAEEGAKKAQEAGDPAALNRRMEDLLELRKDEQDLRKDIADQAKERLEAEEKLAALGRTDKENLVAVRAELSQISAQRAGLASMSFATPAIAAERALELTKREVELRERLKSLETKDKRAAKTETSELDKAKSAYLSLQKKFDPVGESLAEIKKNTEYLDLLLKKGEITTQQRSRALAYLAAEHKAAIENHADAFYKLTVEQDRNFKSLENLRDSYVSSPFAGMSADLAELNRLLKEGAVSMAEYDRLKQRVDAAAKEKVLNGLPDVPTNLGSASATPFSDSMSMQIERAEGMGQFNARQEEVALGWQDDVIRANQQFEMRRQALEAEALQQEEHNARMLELENKRNGELTAARERFNSANATLDSQRAQYAERMNEMMTLSMLSSAESMLGMFASASEEASAAQKVAFAAQKALAVAQILLYTEVAAARAPAEAGTFLGMSLATAIRAQGYASAGLVASLSIGQLFGGGESSGGSSYAGMYDTGGYIPYNQYGVVGEYGPEIVHGPARVTGRGTSAGKLGSDGEYNIHLSPQVNVAVESSGGQGPTEADAKQLAATVKGVVMSTLAEQMRPNGALDNWIRSMRRV